MTPAQAKVMALFCGRDLIKEGSPRTDVYHRCEKNGWLRTDRDFIGPCYKLTKEGETAFFAYIAKHGDVGVVSHRNPYWGSKMKKGDIIREARGGDYALWRIEETYEEDSPYVFGVLVSTHKFHKAGTEKRMIAKADYKVEPDPEGYAKDHWFTVDVKIPMAPTARWA